MEGFSQSQISQILGTLIKDHPGDVKQLLTNSGVMLPDQIDTTALGVALLKAIKDSASFRQYLSDYLAGMVQYEATKPENKNFVSQSGYYNETGDDKKKTALGSLFSGDNLSNLFNTGLGVLADSLSAKSKKESEQRALQAKAIDLQIAEQQARKAQFEKGKGLSTGMVILIVLGAIGIFVGAYFMFKPKKG